MRPFKTFGVIAAILSLTGFFVSVGQVEEVKTRKPVKQKESHKEVLKKAAKEDQTIEAKQRIKEKQEKFNRVGDRVIFAR